MTPGTLYLCATSRLAQSLRQANDAVTERWRTPAALTLAQWQTQMAEEILLSGRATLLPALTAESEQLLWEVVLAQAIGGEASAELFDLSGLAAEAMAAHALATHWQLPAPHAASPESRAFAAWQQDFLNQCTKLQRLPQVNQLQSLVELLQAGYGSLPQHIVLAGFDRFTPLEERLFAAFSARGCTVERQELSAGSTGSVTHQPCADSLAECHAAVAWAQKQLQANPQARLGIVAPDLSRVRTPLIRLLDATLHPASLRPDAVDMPRSYNISLGEPLAQQPLIATALSLLRLLGRTTPHIAQADMSPLLLGSFWAGDDSEADARAQGEARMRRQLPATPQWASVFHSLAAAGASRSAHALRATMTAAQALPRRQLPSQWAQQLPALLKTTGWPGERTLTSVEFQVQQAFLALCYELGQFDALLGPLSFPTALQRLAELCRRRLFQPQTRGEPHIQILGVLESAGLHFDALWVMGLNDELWPPPARPNPLLPIASQQAAGCARASAAVELAFARKVHARLLGAAPQVTLSWASSDGNRILRPSPLLDPDSVVSPLASDHILTLAASRAASRPHERIHDAKAPPLASGELLEGGSGVLKAQALCPAWAFYRYRLAAAALETPVDGLDASLRGTLVHSALQHFWLATKDQGSLLAQNDASRQAAIAEAIHLALADFEQDGSFSLPAEFRQLECERLQRLLQRWLTVETERPCAFSVLACEQEKVLAVGNLRIRVVIDRVDQLADGSLAVLDYKTGPVDTKSWLADRISEPQLPLYAAFGDCAMETVSFARVVLDEPGFSGISAQPERLAKVPAVSAATNKPYAQAGLTTWEAVINHWQRSIGELASEIEHGAAAVVLNDANDLRYCDVLPLLRLAERQRLWQESCAPAR
ncbi:PD-(D/E)XK nuclease family protein [Azonexus hydrophilus]|uniref:PD-(D/E)XK nuclease family protein n=1 Tax=Azonexus hydrophilus TaxID=418702 RepID=UPI00196504FC|nr:PD-(D/E)XK nuclease family protein [Azonexus hydrophilus]